MKVAHRGDLSWLIKDQGYLTARFLPDGRVIALTPFLFTWGILVDVDWLGYANRYCYTDLLHAKAAFDTWDGIGDPEGYEVKK